MNLPAEIEVLKRKYLHLIFFQELNIFISKNGCLDNLLEISENHEELDDIETNGHCEFQLLVDLNGNNDSDWNCFSDSSCRFFFFLLIR